MSSIPTKSELDKMLSLLSGLSIGKIETLTDTSGPFDSLREKKVCSSPFRGFSNTHSLEETAIHEVFEYQGEVTKQCDIEAILSLQDLLSLSDQRVLEDSLPASRSDALSASIGASQSEMTSYFLFARVELRKVCVVPDGALELSNEAKTVLHESEEKFAQKFGDKYIQGYKKGQALVLLVECDKSRMNFLSSLNPANLFKFQYGSPTMKRVIVKLSRGVSVNNAELVACLHQEGAAGPKLTGIVDKMFENGTLVPIQAVFSKSCPYIYPFCVCEDHPDSIMSKDKFTKLRLKVGECEEALKALMPEGGEKAKDLKEHCKTLRKQLKSISYLVSEATVDDMDQLEAKLRHELGIYYEQQVEKKTFHPAFLSLQAQVSVMFETHKGYLCCKNDGTRFSTRDASIRLSSSEKSSCVWSLKMVDGNFRITSCNGTYLRVSKGDRDQATVDLVTLDDLNAANIESSGLFSLKDVGDKWFAILTIFNTCLCFTDQAFGKNVVDVTTINEESDIKIWEKVKIIRV